MPAAASTAASAPLAFALTDLLRISMGRLSCLLALSFLFSQEPPIEFIPDFFALERRTLLEIQGCLEPFIRCSMQPSLGKWFSTIYRTTQRHYVPLTLSHQGVPPR
jgi:hypothetical protein